MSLGRALGSPLTLLVPLALAACAGDPVSGDSANAGGSDASTTASGPAVTGPLQVGVKNRAVTLGWEEDEHLHHCLDLTQPRPGKSPVSVSLCTKAAGQTSITLGEVGAPGVDYSLAGAAAFQVGPATWRLRGGASTGQVTSEVASGSLRVGPHFSGPCTAQTGVTSGITEWNGEPPVTLEVSVQLGEQARQNVDITTPAIWVDSVPSTGGTGPGSTLKFSYTLSQRGMYTLEVNNAGGGAIVNCAVYAGADVPLAPVEVKGGAGLALPPDEAKLGELRAKLLQLTNAERAKVGLAPLALDDKLNQVAQYHSDDMAKRGFFGHGNPDGLGPQERAAKFGFTAPVGENIAAAQSVEGAHNGLYWSAGHRANMLGKDWGRVGFGVAKSAKDTTMLVTENFSTPAK
jgi:uncharacterized protein YkwD